MSQTTVLDLVKPGVSDGPHVVFGGAISRALVANLGVVKAARVQNVKISSIGGISAGAVMSLLYAAGVSTEEMETLVMAHSLGDFMDNNHDFLHWPRLLWRVLNHRRYLKSLPSRGLYNTHKLGAFIDERVKAWPENYWTMAYSPRDEAQVIFSNKGVQMRYRDGRVEEVDSVPAPIGLAIRATCAVPGFFDSIQFVSSSGRTIELFDGFLSWDGYCPAPFVEEFFGVERRAIVACDVIRYKTPNRLLDKGYLAVLTPNPPFPAHTFHPTRDQKQAGLTEAFAQAHAAFASMAGRPAPI
ncbi:MAG: patatin-like phospholipase family protein [Cyanobacteria bacterium SZAS TMP-1]|nr:patatin-like phospholipase family protein [Cyanobacteria bacterium SZAS TMP-1]